MCGCQACAGGGSAPRTTTAATMSALRAKAGHPGLEPGIAGFGDRCLSQLGQCPLARDSRRADTPRPVGSTGMSVEFGIFPVPNAEHADQLLEHVIAAEQAGLDLVGIQDHPYQRRFLDTWSLIAFLAARTERIRFFPDVANLPLRQPAVMAKAAASTDLLSGGRFELGLGAGAFWDGIAAMGGPG